MTPLASDIRDALQATVGRMRPYSVADCAKVTGLHPVTIYQLSNGQLTRSTTLHRHLVALLEFPPFTEHYLTVKGYQCCYLTDEDSGAWTVAGSVLECAGEIGDYIRDGVIDHHEERKMADRLKGLIRKATAFFARVKGRRATV